MSIGGWFRLLIFAVLGVVAFGLLMVALGNIQAEYARQEHEAAVQAAQQKRTTTAYIAKECLPLQSLERTICVGEALKAQHEAERGQSDLNAQWMMAIIAGWLLLITGFQAFVSIGGIYYVSRSLDSSTEAVRLTKQALIAEHRPWVKVTVEPKTMAFRDGKVGLTVVITAENVGKGPAKGLDLDAVLVDRRDMETFSELGQFVRSHRERYGKEKYSRDVVLPRDPFIETFYLMMDPVAVACARRSDDEDGRYVLPELYVQAIYRSALQPEIEPHLSTKAFSFEIESARGHGVSSLAEDEVVVGGDIQAVLQTGSSRAT